MALLTCPECGNHVSDKAFACPHCGKLVSSILTENEGVDDKTRAPLSLANEITQEDDGPKNTSVNKVETTSDRRSIKGKVIVLVVCAILVFGAGLTYLLSEKPFSTDKRIEKIQRLIDNQKYNRAEEKCDAFVRSFNSLTNGQRKSLVGYYKALYEQRGDKTRYDAYLRMLLDLNDYEISSYLNYGYLNDVMPLRLDLAKTRFLQGDSKSSVALCDETYQYSDNLNTEFKCELGSLYWALGLDEFDSHLMQKGLKLANQSYLLNKDSALKALSENDKLYCTGMVSSVRISRIGFLSTDHLLLEGCLSDGKKNYEIEMDLQVDNSGEGESAVFGTYRYLSKPIDARLEVFGTLVFLKSTGSELTLFCVEGIERFDLLLDDGLNVMGSWRKYKDWDHVKTGADDYIRKLKVILCDKNGIDRDVLRLLQSVYPNSLDGNMRGWSYTTARFGEYSSEECDYDPIYRTQDGYSYGILPEPMFKKLSVPGLDNVYKVEWQVKYGEEITKHSVNIVLTREGGQLKIDNIWDETTNKLLFDYSKPPVPWYGD